MKKWFVKYFRSRVKVIRTPAGWVPMCSGCGWTGESARWWISAFFAADEHELDHLVEGPVS